MRKIKELLTIVLIIAFLLISCLTEEKPIEKPLDELEEQTDPNNSLAAEEIMDELQLILNDEPTLHVLISFINSNIGKVTTENADRMIDALESLLNNNKDMYEYQINKLDLENELIMIAGQETRFKESSISQLENKELKSEVQYLYDNYYQLVNLEGQFYLEIDYAKYEQYKNDISDGFQKYLEIMSMESTNRSMADAALLISFNELAERIYKTEDYLKIASSDERKASILEDYEFKLNAYLKGLPNTSIMGNETNKIKDEVLESYQTTADKDYEISAIVNNYLKLIEANNQVIDDQMLQNADSLIENALLTVGK